MADTMPKAGVIPDRRTPGGARRGGVERLWRRSVDRYPENGRRFAYLGITVLAAVILYYQLYVPAAVTPSIISHYHATWSFFVYILVVGNAVGAFASLVAGLADRWGRANIVTYGLLVTALLVLFGLPNAPNIWAYATLYSVLCVIEGMCLVALPALVRDFTPQMGRASAMGFYTMGPVLGSLVVAQVASHTLSHLHAWQDQFVIAGIVGLVAFSIALFFLRELSPGLRDQLMVSIKDRALVEARAAGVNIDESIKHPWRQILHLDVIGPSVGIATFLMIYYAFVAFFVVYMATIYGYSEQRANSLGNWMWAANAIGVVIIGFLSDRLRVRKPFMVVGAIGAIAFTALFALRTNQTGTGYYQFVWIISLLAIFLGTAYSPWMAAFTETVEKRNPALTATGLAVWGWTIRAVVSISFLVTPFVVTSMTPLIDQGAHVKALASQYSAQLTTLGAIDPATVGKLQANPSDTAAIGTAVTEISQKLNVSPAAAVQQLIAVSKVPTADLTYLQANGPKVQKALGIAPGEWRRWWWVCLGGEVLFLPLIFLLKGRWSPKRARQDEEEHERMVDRELAALLSSHSG
ncbi:MAG TPA: MFS transporter [Acidimicrobiales bacterium]|nr:MFS transporter [Acidimicrobiales bacterium]